MNGEKEVLFKKETKSLIDKVFIVTGANRYAVTFSFAYMELKCLTQLPYRGFGYAITETLVERHATVIMACRDENKAYEAISKIRLKTATGNLVNFKFFVNFIRSTLCVCRTSYR